MDYEKIGEYIQLKRKAVGLTQAELGDKLGVTSKAVSKWECGVALPDVSLFLELSEILKIDVSELLVGKDNEVTEDKISKRKNIAIVILAIIVLILLITSTILGIYFINNYDRIKVYQLTSENEDFYIEGKIDTIDDDEYVSISNVDYLSKNDSIFGYYVSYELYYEDKLLYQSRNVIDGDIDDNSLIDFRKLLGAISIFVRIPDDISFNLKSDADQYFLLKINLLDENNKVVNYGVPITLKWASRINFD